MKEQYLSYNPFLKNYTLIDGPKIESARRTEIGKLESEKLDKQIEPKRKSILYVVGPIPEEDYNNLERKYTNSKVTLVRK